MRTIDSLFDDYASYHQTPGNKAFHRLGIPMIMLTLIALLQHVPLVHAGGWRVDAAMLVIAVAEVYYLTIEWRLGLLMLVVSAAFYALGLVMPLWLSIALFILGWILQFLGHSMYEHRQPAFFRNFLHLLVGPLWILNGFVPVVKR